MVGKQKYDDAHNRNQIRSWSNLTHDVLSLAMMKLEVVDFLSFSKVCNSWGSLALSNRNKFILSKPPMSISFCDNDANEKSDYYLEDFNGRKLNINLPHFAKRTCVGVTCGYLVLYGEETHDFLLVNPITKYELHFPKVIFCCPGKGRIILVFLPSISKWGLVVSSICHLKLWFRLEGTGEWTKYLTPVPVPVYDLIAFKGKIYAVQFDCNLGICEVTLYPDLELVVLISHPKPDFRYPGFVRNENLYLIDRFSDHPYNILEIDLE